MTSPSDRMYVNMLSRTLVGFVVLLAALSAVPANAQVNETLNRKGRFELSLNVAGAVSFGSYTPDGGEADSSNNIYATASLVAGYMILDNLELRLSLGGQYIGRSLADGSAATNPGLMGAIQVLYQRDIVRSLAVYAGLGGGGFYGSRSVDAGAGLSRSFTSVGGLGQVLLGLLVTPGPRLILRGGLRADFLFGSESASDDVNYKASFFTTQILFDVGIGIRFG